MTNGMPSSRWSLIDQACQSGSTRRRLALDELLRQYYRPLMSHLTLRMRIEPATADDILQGFIAEKILARDLLATADRNKGRFRSLLLRSLENYAIDQLRRFRRVASLDSSTDYVDVEAEVVEELADLQRIAARSTGLGIKLPTDRDKKPLDSADEGIVGEGALMAQLLQTTLRTPSSGAAKTILQCGGTYWIRRIAR